MITRRFELLKEANRNAGLSKPQVSKITRSKYWGELACMDSQMQIDRDFVRFQHHLATLPSKAPKAVLAIEQVASGNNDDKQAAPFRTKYGSLSLSGALPNVNFKIDDLDEYEFVQRQRAFLYDPLHIKGSSQFKSFSTQVGFASLGHATGQGSRV